jgi:cysteinyl-tRNA synthetase
MLGAHYRQPINWTKDRLEDAKAQLQMLVGSTRKENFADRSSYEKAWKSEAVPSLDLVVALSDDLNTADAIAKMKTAISKDDSLNDEERLALVHDARFLGLLAAEQRGWLTASAILSNVPVQLFDEAIIKFRDYRVFVANNDVSQKDDLDAWFASHDLQVDAPERLEYVGQDLAWTQIEKMRADREAARAAKDWAEADRIRDELKKKRITLQDNPDGTTTLHYHHVGETGRYELRGSAATLEVKR